jgi:general secretion pathway protein C
MATVRLLFLVGASCLSAAAGNAFWRPANYCAADEDRPPHWNEGVLRLDDNHFEIDAAGVANSRANGFKMNERIVPSFRKGRPIGFKIFSIRPGSLYFALGLREGDIVRSINGYDLNSPDKALAAYSALRHTRSLDLKLTRAGRTHHIHYEIL